MIQTIQHLLFARQFRDLLRAVCWQPSGLVRRHDSDRLEDRREPGRESLAQSLRARRLDRSRRMWASLQYTRLDVCDH